MLFTEPDTFRGDANLNASHWSYTTFINMVHPDRMYIFFGSDDMCDNRDGITCLGHSTLVTVPGSSDSNTDPGDRNGFYAQVKIGTVSGKSVRGKATNKTTTTEGEIYAEVSVTMAQYVSGTIGGKYRWTDENGVTYTESSSTEIQIPNMPIELTPKSTSVYVGNGGDAAMHRRLLLLKGSPILIV